MKTLRIYFYAQGISCAIDVLVREQECPNEYEDGEKIFQSMMPTGANYGYAEWVS